MLGEFAINLLAIISLAVGVTAGFYAGYWRGRLVERRRKEELSYEIAAWDDASDEDFDRFEKGAENE